MAKYYGYNMPFLGGTQAVLGRQEDLRLIKNDVLQLIMTIPTERIHRPDFGTILRSTLMEQMTSAVLDRLRTNLLSAITTNEPRLTNVQVQLVTSPAMNSLSVTILGQLADDPTVNFLLQRTFNSTGGQQ